MTISPTSNRHGAFGLGLAVMMAASACTGSAAAVSPTPSPTLTATLAPPSPTPTPLPPTVTPAPTATPAPQVTRPAGEIDRGNRDRAEMALTFDCGASGVPTPAILQALRDEGVRTTFFLTGQWATRYPDLARQISAEHEVANHSWSHPDFRELSDEQIRVEMQRTDDAIRSITGVSTKPIWRAPYGSRDARILRAVAAAGWTYHIFWTADSGDWLDISPEEVKANVTRAARNGAIIVQHCGSPQSAAVTREIIVDLKAKGFRLVAVSELLRD